ncbi:hypothetical protein ACFFLS_24470 [Flavobacterium procerum]|uniref:Uncharacterized protein n=1 Tax=Flavobacterium procerum TaxID=1455569 RepID=A0ABV6BZQ9_9FLAO
MKTKESYNQDVLKLIQIKYGYSYDYIRKSIRGDRLGDVSNTIKAEYNKLNDEARKAIMMYSKKL